MAHNCEWKLTSWTMYFMSAVAAGITLLDEVMMKAPDKRIDVIYIL